MTLSHEQTKILHVQKLQEGKFVITGTNGLTVCRGNDLTTLAHYIYDCIEPRFRKLPLIISNNYFANEESLSLQYMSKVAIQQITKHLKFMDMIEYIDTEASICQ